MRRLVAVRSYPEGPRVWICGQRVHHGAWAVLLAPVLARKHRRLAAVATVLALHDRHDWRVWFAREGVPAGERPRATSLDTELSIP